ncbi:MAG: hypothetical protein ACR2NN_11835 [Bryobacteraceae bacterium]
MTSRSRTRQGIAQRRGRAAVKEHEHRLGTAAVLVAAAYAQGQPTFTISTVAGIGGSGGFSCDGGPAASAGLNPNGIAVDAAGNLYIVDIGNERIRKVASNGTITTVAGSGGGGFSGDGGPATKASLNQPSRVAVDSAGNLYIADSLNNRVRKVATDGTIPRWPAMGALAPSAMAVRPPAPHRILSGIFCWMPGESVHRHECKRSAQGDFKRGDHNRGKGTQGYSGDGGPATSASMNTPRGLAIDTAGGAVPLTFILGGAAGTQTSYVAVANS